MNAPEHLTIERAAIEGAIHIPINLLAPSPTNPRKHFDQARLDELATSIKTHSVLQPILVRPIEGAKAGAPLYEIVAGERRWRGSKLAEQPSIPALVRLLTDFEVLEMQVIENLQREDLSPIEEAEGYHSLLRKPDGTQGYATAEELAHRIGKSRRYVFNRLKLLDLVEDGRKSMEAGTLSASIALLVARLPKAVQPEALEMVQLGWGGEPYTQRAAAAMLEKRFMLQLEKAVFPIADASLVPAVGSCSQCPKRTGANPDLFDDVKSADTCTDEACFHAKTKAHQDREIQQARDRGQKVLLGDEARKVMPHGEWSLSNTNHVNLDKSSSLTKSNKPLRELLGEDFGKAVLVRWSDDDSLLHVAKESDVRAVLKAKGLLSEKAAKGEKPAKKQTAEQILQSRDLRETNMLMQRLPGAMWRFMATDESYGVPSDSLRWMRRFASALIEYAEYGECYGLARQIQDAAIGSMKVKGEWLEALDVEGLCRASIVALLTNEVSVEPTNKKRDPRKDANDALALEIGFDLAALRATIAEEIDAQLAVELEALATGKSKEAKAKGAKVAKRASTPPISAAAQGAKPAPVTPEQALADTFAKDSSVKVEQKAKVSPAPKAGKKTNQKDKPATPAPTLSAAAANPFPDGAPASTAQLVVGGKARVKPDVKGRAKTAGREGLVDSIDGDQVVLRWGPRSHEKGVYTRDQVEAIAAIAVSMRVKKRPDPKVAWPFPNLLVGTVFKVEGTTATVSWDNGTISEHAEAELQEAS